MNEVLTAKIIFIFTMIGSAGIVGYAPMMIKSFYNSPKIVSVGNCFAAGIFLLVGIVHLLADSQEAFDETFPDDPIPLGYIIVIAGYALMVFIENIIFPGHNHSHEHVEENKNDNKENAKKSIEMKQTVPLNANFEIERTPHECENIDCPVSSSPHAYESYLPGAVLTAALVVHSIFEGIAMGLLDTQSSVISLGVAILIHNVPAALALAIKFKGVKKWISALLMLAFIISSPIGIAIGISLSNLAYPAIKGTFLGISAGTFIYIACTEIMSEEMAKPNIKVAKYIGFLVGFIPLALASIFIKD